MIGWELLFPGGTLVKKFAFILLAAALVAPVSVRAATLLVVDLDTPNQITIAATDGLSAATVSGPDVIGFYMDQFYPADPLVNPSGSPVVGDLTSAQNTSNGFQNLWNSTGFGLNVWAYTDDPTSDFVAGLIAFSGSATWTLDPGDYAAMLGGPASGLIYFPADDDFDLSNATVLGEWEKTSSTVIPLPAAFPLLLAALGGLGFVARRRKVT